MTTMTKKNFLKLAMTIVTMFMFTAAMGQVANDDYEQYSATLQSPTEIDYVTFKEGGTTMGYYAFPDLFYHPNYNEVGSWALTADFIWNWSVPTIPDVTVATIDYPVTGMPANYVEITFPEMGNYIVNVAEQASAAFGGCADLTPTEMNVLLINPPTAQFSTADPEAQCANFNVQTLTVSITEEVPEALARYAFKVTEVVENINLAGESTATLTTNNDFYVAALDSKVAATGTQPNFAVTVSTSDMVLQNDLATRYTYTLASADGVTNTGIVSGVSHKSDYLSAIKNGYDFGAKNTVVFIMYPNPATGPIYHIPNNF